MWLVLKFVIGTYNSSVDMVFDVFVTLFYTCVLKIILLKTVKMITKFEKSIWICQYVNPNPRLVG